MSLLSQCIRNMRPRRTKPDPCHTSIEFLTRTLKGNFMKLISTALALTLMLSGAVFAADKHDHGHEDKPLHGGLVTEIKDVDYELVAKPDVLQLYVRDHGKPVDVSKATAKITLLAGTDKQEVELKPSGDKLQAKGSFKVTAGTKIVAQVNAAGKTATARFLWK
jgi:hypothetical protein